LPVSSPYLASGERQYRLEACVQDDPVVSKALLTGQDQQPDERRGKLKADRHMVIVRRHEGLIVPPVPF
jgi:hypothetical protein